MLSSAAAMRCESDVIAIALDVVRQLGVVVAAGSDIDPQDTLTLACRYFDRGLAGYIGEDDLRDIALMTGGYMSRERTYLS